MTEAVLVSELSDADLDAVGGGLNLASPLTGLSLNVAVLNFGSTAQSASTNQQQASITSVLTGWGGGYIKQRLYSETEAEID